MFNRLKKHELHIIFLIILSLNYIVPLLIFGEITLFWHDTLDSEIVFNYIIGKAFSEDFEYLKLFLNEQIKIEYLRRAFQPFISLYVILNPELAYWFTDILVKLTSYFSFFILAKKINKNIIISATLAALFASINERTVEGFGLAFMPYLVYLISFKQKIRFKHYILTFLFGINTDLVTCLTSVPALLCIIYILNTKNLRDFLSSTFYLMSIFVFSILISNINLIYGQIKYDEIQRLDFFYEFLPLLENLKIYLVQLFKIPGFDNWTLLKFSPIFLFFVITTLITLSQKNKKSIQLLILILVLNAVPFFYRTEFITNIRNLDDGLFKTFNFDYITSIIPLVFSILMATVLDNKIFYKISLLFFTILFFFQVNSSVVPLVKKINSKNTYYQNVYTFNGYYMFRDYKKIKDIVGKGKTISIGYDPMVAVMNNIYAIDGYHNIYPLNYKAKFREVIRKELDKNPFIKNYYDYWGNRVYAFIKEPSNIEINFLEAKSLRAQYVISKYKINSNDLILLENNFQYPIFLYKIN